MKTLLTCLFILIASQAFASEVEILSHELGLADQNNAKTLCLTIIKVPETEEVFGVLESIEDCYYARQARRSPDHKIDLDLDLLSPVTHPELLQHLQNLDGQLKFLFSEGE